ncbi:RIO1 family-domain-containing protein [Kockovaella imperatae]|uniref:Serine/threonine-protein kinase RIO1 n=1 Tax=Kockovaella imperatae TaxID=4999 RepID=A0A1Y1UI81_9TREE|nr:RIO1 family-domain-containing protein [Kockovaella imperatae]ORX37194.1 RIO1 family-domain-containing protein [Kockovaella imperatae]
MSSGRPDGVNYIDTVATNDQQNQIVQGQHSSASASGSSTEEEVDEFEQHGRDIVWDDAEVDDQLKEDSEEREESDDGVLAEESEDLSSDAVENADWELSTRDFTKQYNRLRQHQQATSSPHMSGSARPPLPSQNSVLGQNGSRSIAIAGTSSSAKLSSTTPRQTKDKSDRATQDQVMDSRTRLVLSGFTNRGVIGRLERCISSGKEANVYFASPPESSSRPAAVKVYRTSILKFRSRQNYIVGEHRFSGEYSSSRNARKMVRVWAEKELRNLKRLEQAGVPAPRVIDGNGNVLIMDFLGRDGVASPRLKDADIAEESWQGFYVQLLLLMRKMFTECRLVHADLSEYNILLHDDQLYIIDVSQSVEWDHPKSMEFLRTDIKNMTAFFQRRGGPGIKCLGLKRAWEFIVSMPLAGKEHDEAMVNNLVATDDPQSSSQEENVFMTSFIPQSLGDIRDPEAILRSEVPEALDRLVVGSDHEEVDTDSFDEISSAAAGSDVDSGTTGQKQPDILARRSRHEDKETKKERKQAVKAENRAKRETKMPKGEKKKLIKQSKVKR